VLNTVENVFVQMPEAGVWTVEVRADEVVQDGHKETMEVDADYALVVTGGMHSGGGGGGPDHALIAQVAYDTAR
jgi:hypothetical protein